MTTHLLLAFWAVSILFVITPGADWAFAISAGIRGKAVWPAVTGLLSGHIAATLVVAAGVGTLVAQQPDVLTVLTCIGSTYLLWLGIRMLLARTVDMRASPTGEISALSWWTKGACVSGLNPKVFLLFLALLPQFVDPTSRWPVSAQMVTLGLVHILSCAVVYVAVGFGARKMLGARPSAATTVTRISGAAMLAIAMVLLIRQFFS
ncbi:LysE family translocator [Pseudoxanthomonas sp.]|uniref:LysE family translocator n=1 Tax=Pseudoxanthomonas sp. TaxID=1871049 RepID=UPI002634A765|nr:LysE family translocator [Pseudoxanthomonas sp.]WDS35055.1 MAG: LysE family translocator [Pseudoxanthomonas sp.]